MLQQLNTTGARGEIERFRLDAAELLTHSCDVAEILELGTLALNHGHLTLAEAAFLKCDDIEKCNNQAAGNLAGLYQACGEFDKAIHIYELLLAKLPDHAALRRNLLTTQEYGPDIDDRKRFVSALGWGRWAIRASGGERARPLTRALNNRPIRVGYVSADICQHTVGLLVKDVIKAHRADRVVTFVYSAGRHSDWVTQEINRVSILRDVSMLSDMELAKTISDDKIDVLVDLSGHTAGSRLTAFAYRPAPVMMSWLGYFATTGLPYIDAVLLDAWHTIDETQNYFVEPIVHLPGGRFFYKPVSWAPATVAQAPFLSNGHVTFGCFNNTAKINGPVIRVWSTILNALPNSHLILKWRTFNDEGFCQKIWRAFGEQGISQNRIELRGPSFHKDLLLEYADIDIALDPFPFTGGLTTCEALWMGVPVITLPQTRVVSRQSHAILNTIGLSECSAENLDQYVEIALSLAKDQHRLRELRFKLRGMMQRSSLMDLDGFTRALEDCFFDVYRRIEQEVTTMEKRLVLHVGPGHKNNGAKLPLCLQGPGWVEVRFDIDPNNEPDIVGSMLDMAEVYDQSVDAVFSSHNIEHVYEHQVEQVLHEFLRVLKPGGFALITCPDMQSIGQWLAEGRLNDDVYKSPAGAIRPIDIIYGHSASIASGHEFMAHKTGFTLSSLTSALKKAGFAKTAAKRRPGQFDLWAIAVKGDVSIETLQKMAERLLP